MGMTPIQGPGQRAQTGSASSKQPVESRLESAMKAMKEESATFDKEAMSVGKKQITKEEGRTREDLHSAVLKKEQVAMKDQIRTEHAAQAGIGSRRKSKKKKSISEEQLEELAELEGQIDIEGLPKDEQSVWSEFFEKMGRIRSLKRELKKQEKEREELEEKQEEQEEKQQQEE